MTQEYDSFLQEAWEEVHANALNLSYEVDQIVELAQTHAASVKKHTRGDLNQVKRYVELAQEKLTDIETQLWALEQMEEEDE